MTWQPGGVAVRNEHGNWKVRGTVERFRASDVEEIGRLVTPRGPRRLGVFPGRLREPTADELLAFGADPYSRTEFEDNVLLNAGITLLLNLLIGAGGTVYSNANCRLGVGDGNGSVPTAAATDTGLAAPTNRYYQQADATYPSVAAQTMTVQSTFPTGQGNYAWNEWDIDNGGASSATPGGTSLNHKGQALGTKTSAAAWAFKITLTIS